MPRKPALTNPLLRSLLPALMALAFVMLSSGCATNSPPSPPQVVAPPSLPPLPATARQPTPPAICSPTCASGLMQLRKELLDSLTQPLLPALPASAPTTAPTKP